MAGNCSLETQSLIDANPQIVNPDLVTPGTPVCVPSACCTSIQCSASDPTMQAAAPASNLTGMHPPPSPPPPVHTPPPPRAERLNHNAQWLSLSATTLPLPKSCLQPFFPTLLCPHIQPPDTLPCRVWPLPVHHFTSLVLPALQTPSCSALFPLPSVPYPFSLIQTTPPVLLQGHREKAPLLQLRYLVSRVTPQQALNLQEVQHLQVCSPKTGCAWV